MSTRQHLLLSACGAGLSCASVLGGALVNPPAAAATAMATAGATASARVQKTLDQLGGTKAAGSTRNSPFAGAKESDTSANELLRAKRGRLWWLLLPVGLAAISYGALRAQESSSDA
jgi:hypothetical protein